MEEVRTCVTKRNSLGLQRMSADWNKETAAVRLFGHPPTKSKVWSLHEVSEVTMQPAPMPSLLRYVLGDMCS